MKKLLFLAIGLGALILVLEPQWRSLADLGFRRFATLDRPRPEILVGVCWPFSINQDGMADGIQLALEEINSSGLAAGYAIRLLMRDDGFDWETNRSIALEFARNSEMSAVIGYYDDSLAIKASLIFEASRLLHLIIGANSTVMTSRGFQYIVRTVVSNDKIASGLARVAVERGIRKFALIWEEDAFGENLAYQLLIRLNALSSALIYQWSFHREHADFRIPANELKAINADMCIFAGMEPWSGDFLKEARKVGIKMPVFGTFSDNPQMRRRAGDAIEGAIYYDLYNPASLSPQNRTFVQKFRSRYGKDPDDYAAQGYDALYLLAQAVQATHSRNPLDLVYAIRYMEAWEGANGRYKFDSRGELEDKPIYLKKFQGGHSVLLQEIQPEPAAPAR